MGRAHCARRPSASLRPELSVSLLARYYKINFESGMRDMQLLMENPKEYACAARGGPDADRLLCARAGICWPTD